jgi:hypothetical protein
MKLDSWGKTALRHCQSLIPKVLLFGFFPLYALERQISESKNDQQHMSSTACPAPALKVIQTQLLLQLPVMKETTISKIIY